MTIIKDETTGSAYTYKDEMFWIAPLCKDNQVDETLWRVCESSYDFPENEKILDEIIRLQN
tara:strand:+ start:645 stop:827 length:183 start_codon:yes stop_codon:yes gene_type:complete